MCTNKVLITIDGLFSYPYAKGQASQLRAGCTPSLLRDQAELPLLF